MDVNGKRGELGDFIEISYLNDAERQRAEELAAELGLSEPPESPYIRLQIQLPCLTENR
ncbi:MAG: hypothetical protein LVQ95_01715 [Candidatus Micrarchaeales archaeon]|nr:hypothetical protein [Candidatus Micrarchaeales archaeon]